MSRFPWSIVAHADEPTANLDSAHGHEVMQLLRELTKRKGNGVVVVSHDARLAEVADCVLWLEDGRLRDQECAALTAVVDDEVNGSEVSAWGLRSRE